jgi:hypothetical protein
MIYREDFTLPAELMEQVSEQGFDILPELIQVISSVVFLIKFSLSKHL